MDDTKECECDFISGEKIDQCGDMLAPAFKLAVISYSPQVAAAAFVRYASVIAQHRGVAREEFLRFVGQVFDAEHNARRGRKASLS